MKLVVLKLDGSLQKELWKDCKRLPHLKVLCLKDMKNLVKIPHFDELPCLQKLTLENCYELEEIHPSLGNHTSLEYVNVSYCRKLAVFPAIIKMENLTTLKLKTGKERLEFPESSSNMESLETLSLENMGIDALLSSTGEQCTNLTSLELIRCHYLKCKEVNVDGISQLSRWLQPLMTRSLEKLKLRGCGLRDGEIPSVVGELPNLRELDLERNDFTRLHFSLLQLARLKYLNLSNCYNLIELPELPSGIVRLEANNCISITTIRDIHRSCKWLCNVSLKTSGMMRNKGMTITGSKALLESMIQGNAIDQDYPMFLRLKGLEIPKGFLPPLLRGGKYKLNVGENWCNDFCGFLICAVIGDDHNETPGINIYSNKQEMTGAEDDMVWEESDTDKVTFVWYVPFYSLSEADWWDESVKEVKFSYVNTPEYGWCANGLGVRMVERKSESGQEETLTTLQQQYENANAAYMPQFDVFNNFYDGIAKGILDGIVVRLE